MKTNQKGFSVTEILLVIAVVGLVGVVGWLVYNRQVNSSSSTLEDTKTEAGQQEKIVEEKKGSTAYSFNELGISMDILDGWEVNTNHIQEEGVNFYKWTIEKSGADGKISLSSSGFRGGFHGCTEMYDSLTPAVIMEVAPTQNDNLMFMSWSYGYDNETNYRTGIVSTAETVFRTTNSSSAVAIPNKDVSSGNYYFCISEPLAGFALKLNDEPATGFTRIDNISALTSDSSDSHYEPLSVSAESYSEIKSMLTTIK